MKLPPDQKIREEALNTAQSFILEAPAGSGKTALLTARYLALLAGVSHPGQILAVTFTRKAAAEMSARIAQVLARAQVRGELPPEPWESLLVTLGKKALKRHGTHASVLFNPESLRVGTFHGFCASLVRDWPLEAEIPPGLSVLEDVEQETLLQRALQQYVEDLVSGEVPDQAREAYKRSLGRMNNHPDILSMQLLDLLRRRDRLGRVVRMFRDGEDIRSLGERLDQWLESYASRTLCRLRRYFLEYQKDWASLRRDLSGSPAADVFPQAVPGEGLADIVSWKAVAGLFLTEQGTPRKQFGPKNGFPNDFSKRPSAAFVKKLPLEAADLLHFVNGWPDASEDNVGLTALTDILILVNGAWRRLRRLIESRGLDYLELEMAAVRALSKPEHPSESLLFYHEKLRHILVDEVQDLNDVQAEIVARLTEGWEPGDGRTVFLVGDPKQSIYRFRRAEVSLFYELKEKGLYRQDEPPLCLKPLLLSTNFRSRPHLVEFSNRLFEEVMALPNREYDEVQFTPSLHVRERLGGKVPLTAAIFNEEDGPHRKDGSPLDREARWVAESVSKLYEERPDETIAILIPVRTHLATFVRALRVAEVPLCLTEGERLMERPEVRHLQNLFTAMVRPYDDVAWAGVLRAPWLHVSNQVLFDLAHGKGSWSSRVLSGRDRFPGLDRFCSAVSEARNMFGREPFASTVGRLWEDLDGPGLTAARYGVAGVSNGKAFLELLSSCSGLPGEEALLKLDRLLREAYTPPDPGGAFSKIHMMTVHKAKGLEFDHVFAVNLGYNPLSGARGEEPAYRMGSLPGEEKHFLVASQGDRRTGTNNLAYVLLKDLDRQRTLAEARRLFYVVATRAKESLTLTGAGKLPKHADERSSFKSPLYALLDLLSDPGKSIPHLTVRENPEVAVDSRGGGGSRNTGLSLHPPPFTAEPLPYRIASPSRIEDETLQAAPAGSEEEDVYARARGLILHRLLETLCRGGSLPGHEALTVALCGEGIPMEEAKAMAPEILNEASKAWNMDAFSTLRQEAVEIYSEWALEDFDGGKNLRVGRFDLLIRRNNDWVILDYKAARPGVDVDAWIDLHLSHYRPQLRAYAQMVARTLNIPEGKIEQAVLFTALPRLVFNDQRVPIRRGAREGERCGPGL
jgi:ATP-dependent helicase/nuclease subunit A